MSEPLPRTCPGCGQAEARGADSYGRPTLNLEPTTGLCVECLAKRAADRHTFHSRREATAGEVFDARAAAARNDA